MPAWNPSAPNLLGLEWKPDIATALAVTDTQTGVETVASTVAETITDVYVPHGGALGGLGDLIVDITPAGSEIPTGLIESNFAPTSTGTPIGWLSNTGSTSIYDKIDDLTTSPNFADFMIHTSPGPVNSAIVDVLFGSGAFGAGRRIANVQIRAWCRGGSVGFEFLNGGTLYGRQVTGNNGVSGHNSGFTLRSFDFGEICPWTGLAWTQADITGLSSGTTSVRISRADKATGFYSPTVAAVNIHVWSYVENRVAYGLGVASQGATSTDAIVRSQSTSEASRNLANWAKGSGVSYSIIVRRARSLRRSISVGWRQIASQAKQPPPAGLSAASVALGAYGVPTALGYPLLYTAFGFVLNRSGGVASVDSQPYESVVVGTLSGTTRQVLTPPASPASTIYGSIRLLVKAPVSTAQLRVSIRRSSDSALMSSVELIGIDDVRKGRAIGNWTEVQIQFVTPATLLASTAYYVELVAVNATGTTGDAGWRVLALRAVLADAAATFGAGTNFATIDGDTNDTAADLVLGIGVLPASLASIAVVQQNMPLAPPVDPACVPLMSRVRYLGYARISWAATALGSAFARYEVQRRDAVADDWETIASLVDPTITRIDDFEARVGVLSAYRIRQVRTDGISSLWTGNLGGPATVTIDLIGPTGMSPTDDGALLLSSNSRPDLSVAYPDVYSSAPARAFELLEAAETVFRSIYGRDGQVAFRPTERRGVRFARSLLLNALISSKAYPVDVWGPALDLALADIPYVCVRDRKGRRWYTAMQLAAATETALNDGRDAMIFADATFTEIELSPEPVEVPNAVLGYPWSSYRGTWGSDGTKAFLATSGGPINLVGFDARKSDVVVSTTLSWAGVADDYAGIAFRIVDVDNFLLLAVVPTGPSTKALALVKVVNAGITTLWTSASYGISGAVFKVDVSGSAPTTSVKVYENGVLASTTVVTDPLFDGRTSVGIAFAANPATSPTARWDDFSVVASGVTTVDSFAR